jgi:hypothetical protein
VINAQKKVLTIWPSFVTDSLVRRLSVSDYEWRQRIARRWNCRNTINPFLGSGSRILYPPRSVLMREDHTSRFAICLFLAADFIDIEDYFGRHILHMVDQDLHMNSRDFFLNHHSRILLPICLRMFKFVRVVVKKVSDPSM